MPGDMKGCFPGCLLGHQLVTVIVRFIEYFGGYEAGIIGNSGFCPVLSAFLPDGNLTNGWPSFCIH
jgi:hypothetical protein